MPDLIDDTFSDPISLMGSENVYCGDLVMFFRAGMNVECSVFNAESKMVKTEV